MIVSNENISIFALKVYLCSMKTKLWMLTSAVILLNFALVIMNYRALPDQLPLHYDLDGNYTSSMAKTTLFYYPVVSLVLCTLIYLVSAFLMKTFKRLQNGAAVRCTYIDIVTVCIALIILSSTCVTLTSGRNHFFMFAEPALFLVAVAAVVVGEIRIRHS